MSIISVLNPKDGSGKTTISTNLARSLLERGHSVLLVDSDPQRSARDWHAANEDNPIELVALDRPNNVKTLTSVNAIQKCHWLRSARELCHFSYD